MIKVRKAGIAALASILAVSVSVPAYATSESELNSAIEASEESQSELNSVQSRLEELESKKGESEEYLKEVNEQLTELQDQLAELQDQYRDKQTQLDTISQELEDAKADEEVQRENMAIRIQYVYENSSENDQLTAVLEAESFMEMLNAANNISELNEYDRNALQEYADICEDIETKQTEVEEEQEAILELSEQCSTKRDELVTIYEETKAQVSEFADSIDDAESEAAQLLASIQEQEAEIEVLSQKAAEEVAAAEAAAAAGSSSAATAVNSDTSSASNSSADTQSAANTAVETADDSSDEYISETSSESTNESTDASASTDTSTTETTSTASTYSGAVLTRSAGRVVGPSGGEETYYNMDMSGVIQIMRNMGNTDEYWVRDDGVKMLGAYVMVAANLSVYPRGSYVATSLGTGIVCDTGGFAVNSPYNLDIATNW